MDRMVIDEQLARLSTALKLLKGADLAPRRWMDVLRKDLRGKSPGSECLLERRSLLADRVSCTKPGQELMCLNHLRSESTRARSERVARFVYCKSPALESLQVVCQHGFPREMVQDIPPTLDSEGLSDGRDTLKQLDHLHKLLGIGEKQAPIGLQAMLPRHRTIGMDQGRGSR